MQFLRYHSQGYTRIAWSSPRNHGTKRGPDLTRVLLGGWTFSTDWDIQNSLFILILLFAGIRVSSALWTNAYPNTHLDWRDVTIGPYRDEDGSIVGITVTLVFRYWKNYRYKSRFVFKYRIPTIQKRTNIIFDMGFAHAWRAGVSKDSYKPFYWFFADLLIRMLGESNDKYMGRPVSWRDEPDSGTSSADQEDSYLSAALGLQRDNSLDIQNLAVTTLTFGWLAGRKRKKFSHALLSTSTLALQLRRVRITALPLTSLSFAV
ncbi:hypothetical protein IAU59_006760 [Kwoniella sp. CBS 9459]